MYCVRRDYSFFCLKKKLCSPETFDFIYSSLGHGEEE
jgi:hypothetical protein